MKNIQNDLYIYLYFYGCIWISRTSTHTRTGDVRTRPGRAETRAADTSGSGATRVEQAQGDADANNEEGKSRSDSFSGDPTVGQRRQRNVTCCLYRSWCRACVLGRGKDQDHRRADSQSDTVPRVAMGYVFSLVGELLPRSLRTPSSSEIMMLSARMCWRCWPCQTLCPEASRHTPPREERLREGARSYRSYYRRFGVLWPGPVPC